MTTDPTNFEGGEVPKTCSFDLHCTNDRRRREVRRPRRAMENGWRNRVATVLRCGLLRAPQGTKPRSPAARDADDLNRALQS